MRLPIALVAAFSLAAGCTSHPIQTPTRSLDRPNSIQLVCALADPAHPPATILPMSACKPPATDQSSSVGATPQLFLLVTNANRGELAVATAGKQANYDPIDGGARVIDLDPKTPGFGFIPLGDLPEPLRLTQDGCWGVTANQGSCNLTRVDVSQVIGRANGDPMAAGSMASDAVAPIRLNVNGRFIDARPTWVELSPSSLGDASTANPVVCKKTPPRAIVALPGCELVAEVDLATGNLTAAIRITRDGAFPVADLASIQCRPECRGRVGVDLGVGADMSTPADMSSPPDLMAGPDGGNDDQGVPSLDGGGTVDGGGVITDGGLAPILPAVQAWPHVLAVVPDGQINDARSLRLVVGDAVSPRLFMLSIDGTGGGFSVRNVITLADGAQGIERLRISPRIPNLAGPDPSMAPRFIYAIARDRTLRVVEDDAAIECETNADADAVDRALTAAGVTDLVADLTTAGSTGFADPTQWRAERLLRCLPVGSIARSPLASGPGILLPGGSLPRDIVFTRANDPPRADPGVNGAVAAPGLMIGDFAWVIDSAGRASAINLADMCPQPNDPTVSPERVEQSCVPGRFGLAKVSLDATGAMTKIVRATPAPRGVDVMPHRLRTGNARFPANAVAPVEPSGPPRLHDLPTTSVNNVLIDLQTPASFAAATTLCNVDPSGQGCTSEPMPLASGQVAPAGFLRFHDYYRSANEGWSAVWEGLIPGTIHNTGAVSTGALFDASGAFCARGVEVGDKLFLNGCGDDGGCGPDQLCYKDMSMQLGAPGLCVNRCPADRTLSILDGHCPDHVYANTCAPWIQGLLRYRITSVTQTDRGGRVTLAELPLPEHPADTHPCTTDADCASHPIATFIGTNPVMLPTVCGVDLHGGPNRCLVDCLPATATPRKCAGVPCAGMPAPRELDCGIGYTCQVATDWKPLNPRSGDGKPWLCVRAPLLPSDPTTRSVCFGELQPYEIHGGESFIVRGDATGFLQADHPDPQTGACVKPPDVGPARLLRGRLPLDLPPCPASLAMSWLGPLPDDAPAACELPGTTSERFLRFENAVLGFIVRVPTRVIEPDSVATTFVPDDGGVPDGGYPSVADGGGMGYPAVTRVPDDGLAINFAVTGANHAFTFTLASDTAAQLPRAASVAPDGTTLYVVDEGQQNVGSGLRGQVVRFYSDTQSSDSTFQVR